MLNEKIIKKLESMGFKRWTNYGYDRLYASATAIGMRYKTFKHSGRVSYATLNGEKLSNSLATAILNDKMFIDIYTEEISCTYAIVDDAIQNIVDNAKKLVAKELDEKNGVV